MEIADTAFTLNLGRDGYRTRDFDHDDGSSSEVYDALLSDDDDDLRTVMRDFAID